MALEGFLQEFGLADILQLIYFQRKTGILNIEGKVDNIDLSFINGNISGLKSHRRPESSRIGKILIKRGLITQKDLDTAIEMQKNEGIKIGNIFVKHGLVSKEAFMEIVHGQIIDTIVQIFTWKEGKYQFDPQGVPADKEMPINLDTQHLLMDGLRIVDEWSVIEGKLDLNTVYKRVGEPDPDELNDIEKEVLSLIDDDNDVITIINISDSGDFDTSKALISLEKKELIEPIVLQPLRAEAVSAERISEYPFYFVIAGVVLIVLIFIFKGGFDAFKVFEQARTSFGIERLKTHLDIYNITNGRYPQSLEVVTNEKDPWGGIYIYKPADKGFTLFSSGPDGVEGTDDDVY